jgi:hypothetical protein
MGRMGRGSAILREVVVRTGSIEPEKKYSKNTKEGEIKGKSWQQPSQKE